MEPTPASVSTPRSMEPTLEPSPLADERSFPCGGCGAALSFRPAGEGTDTAARLACPHCGHEQAIPELSTPVVERDLREWLEAVPAAPEQGPVLRSMRCPGCGARTTLGADLTADRCAFCGVPVVVEEASASGAIQPQGLLPFRVGAGSARNHVKTWIRGRWLAPNGFQRWAVVDGGALQGTYLPYWTFDADTTTRYTGRRGEHYWTTETYTARENGRTVTRTRRKRHTRWYPASGLVVVGFDDVLIVGSQSLPRAYVRELEPWDLEAVVAWQPHYLAGFLAESYRVDLPAAWGLARERMAEGIEVAIRSDIGGDEQQIHDYRTDHGRPTFKHLLLPVWSGAYRYRDRVYRIVVNGRTGEVQGERPWSPWKIGGLVVVAVVLVAVLLHFMGVF